MLLLRIEASNADPAGRRPSIVDIPADVAMVALLNVHLHGTHDLLEADELQTEPKLGVSLLPSTVLGIAARVSSLPQGQLRLFNSTLIRDSGLRRDENELVGSASSPVGDLPNDVLSFLLNSRYCEVDRFSNYCPRTLFGHLMPGWGRVRRFATGWNNESGVQFTSRRGRRRLRWDVFTERVGVCRDFQHLAITFCRALEYSGALCRTGYLGDIGVPERLPMDFSAWFEAYLGGRWWTFDARNNEPRIGRVLMATGRDAADVAMTTSIWAGKPAESFFVVTEEEAAKDSFQPLASSL